MISRRKWDIQCHPIIFGGTLDYARRRCKVLYCLIRISKIFFVVFERQMYRLAAGLPVYNLLPRSGEVVVGKWLLSLEAVPSMNPVLRYRIGSIALRCQRADNGFVFFQLPWMKSIALDGLREGPVQHYDTRLRNTSSAEILHLMRCHVHGLALAYLLSLPKKLRKFRYDCENGLILSLKLSL
jgi:hypothetical protein